MNAGKETVFQSDKMKKYRRLKWIALILFLTFVAFGVVAFREEITLENFRYLFKYVSFSGSGGYARDGTVIYYDEDDSNRFAVYRGDLVVANNSGVSLFDPYGNLSMSDSFSMSNPVIVNAGKYLVVYDLGGYYLKVYNSFSLLHEKSFDYKIQSVATNVNGYICVASSEKSYHSALFVFNDDFQQVFKWSSPDKFVTDCAISSTNDIYLTTIRAENGDLICELTGLSIGSKQANFTLALPEELPIELYPDRSGTILLSDRSLCRVRSDGKDGASARVDFDEDSIDLYVIGDDVCAVAQNELLVGVNYKLHVFDSSLNEIGTMNFSTQILDMKTYGDSVYLLTRSKFYRIADGSVSEEFAIDGDYSCFELLSADSVALCSDQSAVIRVLD